MSSKSFVAQYNQADKMSLQPPYERSFVMDVSATDYVPANNGVFLVEIRNEVAGDIKYDTLKDTGVIYPADDFDILRVLATKVYNLGTIVIVSFLNTGLPPLGPVGFKNSQLCVSVLHTLSSGHKYPHLSQST